MERKLVACWRILGWHATYSVGSCCWHLCTRRQHRAGKTDAVSVYTFMLQSRGFNRPCLTFADVPLRSSFADALLGNPGLLEAGVKLSIVRCVAQRRHQTYLLRLPLLKRCMIMRGGLFERRQDADMGCALKLSMAAEPMPSILMDFQHVQQEMKERRVSVP